MSNDRPSNTCMHVLDAFFLSFINSGKCMKSWKRFTKPPSIRFIIPKSFMYLLKKR